MKDQPMASNEADKEWEADNDCRTLIDAQEVMNDPARKKAAMKAAKKKMKALKAVESYE